MQKKREQKDYSVPHLTNLNEDPQLCGKIYHNLKVKKKLLIGKGSENEEPDIILRGIGVRERHALIESRGEEYFLVAQDEGSSDYLFCNGERVAKEEKLHNWDRVAIGFNTIFVFRNPIENTGPRGFESEKDIEWEKCHMEVSRHILKVEVTPEENIKTQ